MKKCSNVNMRKGKIRSERLWPHQRIEQDLHVLAKLTQAEEILAAMLRCASLMMYDWEVDWADVPGS